MKFKVYFHQLAIVIFLAIIFLPNVGLFKKVDETAIKKNLNRMPYQFPDLQWGELGNTDFSVIEKWYADKISFITTLSKAWADVNYNLGISPKPDAVVIGKNGWLFTGNGGGHSIDLYTGKEVPLKESMILLVNGLKRMNDVAKQYNVPFVVMVAPEAIEIYSEFLPDYIRKKSYTSVFDQMSYMLPDQHINFIDLRPILKKAKHEYPVDLYFKGDPHWNYVGAYVAYQALAKNVKSNYGMTLDRTQLTFLNDKMNSGGFANELQRDDIWSTKASPDLSHLKILMVGRDIHGVTKKMKPDEGNDNTVTTAAPYENFNLLSDNKDSCLLMSDSYAQTFGIYFHNDFYNTIRVHYFNKHYNLSQLLEHYHPKLIVFEITSRALYYFYNSFSPYLDRVKMKAYHRNAVAFASMDALQVENDQVKIRGWAYLPHQDAATSQTYLKLSGNGLNYYFWLNQELRMDIKKTHTDGENLGVAGFSGLIAQSTLPAGDYKASIIVMNGNVVGEKIMDSNYSIRYENTKKHEKTLPKQIEKLDLKLKPMPLNKEIRMTPAIQSEIWLFNGWRGLENQGVWTTGNETAILFSSDKLPSKFKLVLSYWAFVTPTHLRQRFEIYNVQGMLLKKGDFQLGDAEKTIAVDIDKKRDVKSGYLPVFITIRDPISPSVAAPPSSDTRALGMRLLGIKILSD